MLKGEQDFGKQVLSGEREKRNDELWVIARPRLCARGVRAGLAAGPVCSDARSPCDAGRFRWEIWGGVEDLDSNGPTA